MKKLLVASQLLIDSICRAIAYSRDVREAILRLYEIETKCYFSEKRLVRQICDKRPGLSSSQAKAELRAPLIARRARARRARHAFAARKLFDKFDQVRVKTNQRTLAP